MAVFSDAGRKISPGLGIGLSLCRNTLPTRKTTYSDTHQALESGANTGNFTLSKMEPACLTKKEKCQYPVRITTLRINPVTPMYNPNSSSAQSTRSPAHRRWDAPNVRSLSGTGGNYDATLRPDDPYIHKANRQSFNKQQAIEQLTRHATTWQDLNQNKQIEISYSFLNEKGLGFNDYQKQEARRSIQSWGDVANLVFTENGAPAEGRLTFRITDTIRSADGAYPYVKYKDSFSGDTRYNPKHVNRHTITHEIGHTLGLSHPGTYDGLEDDNKRVYAQDSKAHTVMSYFGAQSSGKAINVDPIAPMMDGISAIQHKYGANYQTRRENNTYGFNSNTGRDYYSLRSPQDAANFCVWDGAGDDTLDVSGYANNQVINLRAGSFSDVGNGRGNVSIARNCLIENAIGGSGHDVLIGNEADNRLTGGAGADRLRGGGGADSFVYNYASDSTPANPDVIMDFTSGTDKIDLRGLERRTNTQFKPVKAFSGRIGDAIVGFNPQTQRHFIAIDLTGNRTADFVVTSTQVIRPPDVLVN